MLKFAKSAFLNPRSISYLVKKNYSAANSEGQRYVVVFSGQVDNAIGNLLLINITGNTKSWHVQRVSEL